MTSVSPLFNSSEYDNEDPDSPPAHKHPRPLHGAAHEEIIAYAEIICVQVNEFATRFNVSQLTILNTLGLGGTPEKHAESLWNRWQQVYFVELCKDYECKQGNRGVDKPVADPGNPFPGTLQLLNTCPTY